MKVAEKIRYKVDNYSAAFPTILEIPSKEHAYGRSSCDWTDCRSGERQRVEAVIKTVGE